MTICVADVETRAPTLLTAEELQEMLGISKSTVYRWVKAGRLRRVGQVLAAGVTRRKVALHEIVDEALADDFRRQVERRRQRRKRPLSFLAEGIDAELLRDLLAKSADLVELTGTESYLYTAEEEALEEEYLPREGEPSVAKLPLLSPDHMIAAGAAVFVATWIMAWQLSAVGSWGTFSLLVVANAVSLWAILEGNRRRA